MHDSARHRTYIEDMIRSVSFLLIASGAVFQQQQPRT